MAEVGDVKDPVIAAKEPLSGGEMAQRIAQYDWSATPLGPMQAWPQPLMTLLRVMLLSGQPMFLAWGYSRTLIYNDSYAPMLAGRHPDALGQPFFDVWHEVREPLMSLFKRVFAGEAIHMDDISLELHRPGRPTEAHFAFSYTPVLDNDGTVSGLFCPCIETTNQVLSERRLAAERGRLAQLFEQTPSFMAVLQGPEHRFVLANASFVRLVDGRAVLGSTFAEALPDAVAQGFLKLLDDVYRSGKALTSTATKYAVQATSGSPVHERFVDFVFQPIADDEGRVTGTFIEGADVTGRATADIALRESEARTRELNIDLERKVAERTREFGRTWAVSPDLLTVIGPDGTFIKSNPAWTTALGWSPEELHARPFIDFVHPDDRAPTLAAWDNAKYGEPVLRFENRYRHKLGGWRCLSWVAVSEDGNVYGSARDVTSEKAQADELAARTVERDRVWGNSRDLLVVVGADGVFRAVNPAWTKILGHQPEEVAGQSFHDFIWPEDADLAQGGLDAAAAALNLTDFENRYTHKDGTPRWISWHTSVEGDLVYAYGRDITAQKQTQTDLADAQDALRQAQKMEAVGQLTGGLAHDFNNLLTGITGSLELMRTRIAEGRLGSIDRYITAAEGAAKRAAALTHRLLAFSRRQTLDPKPTNVNRLVSEMEDLIRRTVGPHIAFEVLGAAELWPTLIDPPQLENALLNLCINARDAMPDGGRITITTANKYLEAHAAAKRDLPVGEYIVLCVADTGTGMTPDVISRAFDPFFTTKPIGMGTGLGLSMIYGFVRQSGGQIRITSKLGRGTSMCLYLPRYVGDADDAEAVQRAAANVQAHPGKTVLVVDDEPTVRMLIAEVLEDAGIAAIEAGDGAAGLKVVQSNGRIDLLITDVGLPGGMNGRQVADAARAMRPGLKVLFITGYSETVVLGNGALDPGMTILTKPFAMEALRAKIAEIL